jgi:hypothetical protein
MPFARRDLRRNPTFCEDKKAIVLPPIETEKLDSAREWNAAIRENVARILRLMPRR